MKVLSLKKYLGEFRVSSLCETLILHCTIDQYFLWNGIRIERKYKYSIIFSFLLKKER